MGLRRCIPICLLLAACGSEPTSVLLRIGAAAAPVDALAATVWVDGHTVGAPQPLGSGAVALPATAIVRLDADAAVLLHVQLDAQLSGGGAATAVGMVETQPHAQVALDLSFGVASMSDGGVDGGGGGDGALIDMTSTDLATHVIASDTFFRPNQVLWGTASDGQVWGGDANQAGPPFAIASKTGFIADGTPGMSYSATLGPPSTDMDVVLSGSLDTIDQSCNFGPVARFADANDFYKAYLDGIDFVLQKQVGGTKTVLGSIAHPAIPGTYYSIHLQTQGTTVQARVWPSSGGEPTSWDLTATDTSLATGQAGLRALVPSCQIHIKSFQATGN